MLVEQPLQAVRIALLLSKCLSLNPSSPMSPHGMAPGVVCQVTLTGCLIVEGGAGSVVRFLKDTGGTTAPRASQTASSSGLIPLDETYAENQSVRTSLFQWSGDDNMQTNSEREQDLLERIRF